MTSCSCLSEAVNSPNSSSATQCLIRMTSLVRRINKRLKRSPVNTKAGKLRNSLSVASPGLSHFDSAQQQQQQQQQPHQTDTDANKQPQLLSFHHREQMEGGRREGTTTFFCSSTGRAKGFIYFTLKDLLRQVQENNLHLSSSLFKTCKSFKH